MLSSLRARLLISYIAIVGIMLCAIGLALLVLLSNTPLPTRSIYQRLETIARTTQPLLEEVDGDDLDRRLSYIAEANDIRVLRIGRNRRVLFDSQGEYAEGQQLAMAPPQIPEENNSHRSNSPTGVFRDAAGQVWLYLALPGEATHLRSGRIVLAAPRPVAPALNLLGDNLLRPLLQAGLIGLVLAIALAAVVSGSLAHSLNKLVGAAQAIAEGSYGQRAPVSGPDEVREVAYAFNDMADQVQQTQKTQRDFLANVSHELKTPLTSIQGFSQAILDGAAANPDHAAQVIYDEAGRMRRLVEDLLDLSRIETGQAPMRREPVDIAETLDAVLANLSLQAGEQDITLARDDRAPLPRIIGDGDRLAQVFTNLIDNAITHTPPGGQVTVNTGRDGAGIWVAVSDTGPGIPQSEVDRIFERFYQVDKSRVRSDRKGTGLGLTISKEIVDAHDGRIQARSQPGQGMTVTIWLPTSRHTDTTIVRGSSRH